MENLFPLLHNDCMTTKKMFAYLYLLIVSFISVSANSKEIVFFPKLYRTKAQFSDVHTGHRSTKNFNCWLTQYHLSLEHNIWIQIYFYDFMEANI